MVLAMPPARTVAMVTLSAATLAPTARLRPHAARHTVASTAATTSAMVARRRAVMCGLSG